MMKLLVCISLSTIILLLGAGNSRSQDASRIALIPGIAGYDTDKGNVSFKDFSVFYNRQFQIKKSSFVSPTFLPELYPRWIFNWGENIGWFPVDEVFRGKDVYRAWVDTLSYGVICKPSEHNSMPFLRPNVATETCAYTSREESSQGIPSIFYCVFWTASGVDSERQCEIVAQTVAGDEKVLAVTEGSLPRRGAGGEAFWYCVFPDVSPESAATKILELMELLTEGGGVSFVNDIGNRHLVGAQAMNLSSYHDQYFVKLSVMGDITDLLNADASYAANGSTGFTPEYDLDQSNGSMFAYYRSFTISPRVTTSVIDYREPSSFVEEQIWSVYNEKVIDFYEKNFPGYECQFYLI